MIGGLFDRTIDLLGNSLDLRAQRQKLLSSNIANQETPGYRAVDIKFEDELRKKEAVTNGQAGVTLARTSALHIPGVSGIAGEPAVLDRATDIEGYDMNSVGIEGEMVRLSENSLMYATSAKMLKSKFNILMAAIREGR